MFMMLQLQKTLNTTIACLEGLFALNSTRQQSLEWQTCIRIKHKTFENINILTYEAYVDIFGHNAQHHNTKPRILAHVACTFCQVWGWMGDLFLFF